MDEMIKKKGLGNLWLAMIVLGGIFVASEICIFVRAGNGLCWQAVAFQIAWLVFILCLFGLIMNGILRVMKDD